MGLAFALGWTPCIGPILAAILAVAASEQTVAKGAGMLAVYSLGLGVPFIAAAFAVGPFAAFLVRFRAHLGLVEKAMGGLLVLTGIAFLTGTVGQASYWLLDTFPYWARSGDWAQTLMRRCARLDRAPEISRHARPILPREGSAPQAGIILADAAEHRRLKFVA